MDHALRFLEAGLSGDEPRMGTARSPESAGHIERMPEKTAQYIRRYLDKYPEKNPPSLLDL